METKKNVNQIDETGKKVRMDWKSVENVSILINCMSTPIKRSDIVELMKIKASSTFGDGTFSMMQKRLEPIIGEFQNKETKLYSIADVNYAIGLYKIHLGQEVADNEIVSTAEKAGVELDVDIHPRKRGASGPRSQTWRNLLTIIKIIKQNGGVIRIDELVEKFKKETKIRTFSVSKLTNDYSNIMAGLGIPFDYSHNKRIGLTEINSEFLIAQKYNESKTTSEKEETKFRKVVKGVRDVLNELTDEERVATIIQIAKILYFSRNSSSGIKFNDIPVIYKREYLKDISMEMVMACMSELRAKIQDESDFKVFNDGAKLSNYSRVLDEFSPETKFMSLVIKVPKEYDLKQELLETARINKVDDAIYEISSINDDRLTRSMMKLLSVGGRILSPSRIEKRIREILDDRIKKTEIMIS